MLDRLAKGLQTDTALRCLQLIDEQRGQEGNVDGFWQGTSYPGTIDEAVPLAAEAPRQGLHRFSECGTTGVIEFQKKGPALD